VAMKHKNCKQVGIEFFGEHLPADATQRDGAPGIVTAEMVKPGAAVVQTGTAIVDGEHAPDVHEDVRGVAGWFAPVIGSVGPMTRASLLENCVRAAERRAGVAGPG
jgi:methylenetetrahydrofolate dehydrogenase (NADP+) / methenyltetrahydrofolate cyclohydrolase